MDQLDHNLTALKTAVAARRRRAERLLAAAPQAAPAVVPITPRPVSPSDRSTSVEVPRKWFARIFGS